jgi:DNA-binding transcriptional LysR family regulator
MEAPVSAAGDPDAQCDNRGIGIPMKDIRFNALDLNLLRVFDAVFQERSVTRVGDRLGLTQSAVSHALGRLRYVLEDELFVRRPEGMVPTPRAEELGPRLHDALQRLQLALAPAEFVPATAERRFTLATNHYVNTVLMPRIIARLRMEAPLAEVRVRPSTLGVAEQLDSGRIDLAVAGFGRVPDRFGAEKLLEDTMVWALSADHPFANGRLTLDRLADIPHVVRSIADEEAHAIDGFVMENGLERRVQQDDGGALQNALAAIGRRRNVGLTVPDTHAALAAVEGSDMAALVPRRIAIPAVNRYRLKLFEPPYACPGMSITMIWHRQQESHAAIAWLRNLVREVAAEIDDSQTTDHLPRVAAR